jgi:hypothetical protein
METESDGGVVDQDTTPALFYSFSGTFGIGPYYVMGGVDLIATDDQIGVFISTSMGPGFDIPFLPGTVNDENSWVTPQASGSILVGFLRGRSLNQDVKTYAGISRVGGVGLGSISGEYLSTVDPTTGATNDAITGLAIDLSFGPPVEGHVYYTTSVQHPLLSNIFTWLAQSIKINRGRK